MNDAGKIIALLLVLFSVAAAILLGGTDVSTPSLAVSEISQGTPGAATTAVVTNYLIGGLVSILVTAVVGGIGTLVFLRVRDWYEGRQKDDGDWMPGPNAGYRRTSTPRLGMGKDELFLFAVLNMLRNNSGEKLGIPRLPPTASPDERTENF